MAQPNPYEAPKVPTTTASSVAADHGWAPCPRCNGTNVVRPGYTWWGGAIGPRLLSHVKCKGCGKGYNGKTGGSNTMGIVLYQVVCLVIAGVAFYLLQRK